MFQDSGCLKMVLDQKAHFLEKSEETIKNRYRRPLGKKNSGGCVRTEREEDSGGQSLAFTSSKLQHLPGALFCLFTANSLFYFFSFECLSSKVNNNKNQEMVSNVLNSCLRDQKASAKPLELSNPKGRSCLSGEVLAAETLEISGVGFFFFIVRTFNKSAATNPGSMT